MFMNIEVNMMSVLGASAAYFFIGWLWYSVVFNKHWMDELGRHGIKKPAHDSMTKSLVLTFITNFVTALAMAHLVVMTNSTTSESGIQLGLLVGLGFAATSLASLFVWQHRSLKLFFIDAGYAVVGIIASGVILSLWR